MRNILYLSFPNEGTMNPTGCLTCPRSPARTRTKCSSLKPRGSQLYGPLPCLQVPPLNPDRGLQDRLCFTSSTYSNPLFRILLTRGASVLSLTSPSSCPDCGWGEEKLAHLSTCPAGWDRYLRVGETVARSSLCPCLVPSLRSPIPILGTLTLPSPPHTQRKAILW